MEEWNVGILEYWDKSGNKQFKLSKNPSNPSFHYSTTPLLQFW